MQRLACQLWTIIALLCLPVSGWACECTGQQPAGCTATGGTINTSLGDVFGNPIKEPVRPGDKLYVYTTLRTGPDSDLGIVCDNVCGEVSVDLPDDSIAELHGFPGTPDVPVFGYDPGEEFFSDPAEYTVSAEDVGEDGRVHFRIHYANGFSMTSTCGPGPSLNWNLAATVDLSGSGSCDADLDGDGEVGFTDFLIVMAYWGPCDETECPGDADGDGDVGATDLNLVLADWGACQ